MSDKAFISSKAGTRRWRRLTDWLHRYRIEVLLFALFWSSYAYFYQSTGTNEAVRFDQLRAVVYDHAFTINKYCFNSPDLTTSPSPPYAIYPNKAPGMTFIAAIPFTLLATLVRSAAAGLPEWIFWHLISYLTIISTVGLLSGIAAVLMYRLLTKLTSDRYFSAIAVIAVWFGTLVFPYSTLFYSHMVAGALLVIAFYLLFELRFEAPAVGRKRLAFVGSAGVLIGCSVATEYPTALLGGILCAYAFWITWRSITPLRDKLTEIALLLFGLITGGTTLAVYNLIAFGNVFYIPYEAYSAPGSAFYSSYAHTWMGLHWVGLNGFLHALATVLFNRPMGLLYLVVGKWHIYACNPVLWLTLAGLPMMIWVREFRPEGLVVAAMVIVYLLFIGSYGSSIYDRGGGLYFGPRHMIPVLPFLTLPLYFAARYLRPVFYALAAVSIFYMLLDTAVEPRISFPFGDPVRDFLLPDYLRGQLAQNTASLFDTAKRYVTNDSTAANLAKLAHVPGRFQLVPLMVWWLITGTTLLLWLGQKGERVWRYRTTALCLFVAAIAFAPPVHHAMTVPHTDRHGLVAKSYLNASWQGNPVHTEIDPAIDFDWSKNPPYPAPFSFEWAGDIMIERPGHYEFTLSADDGALLEIEGNVVVDALHAHLAEKNQTLFLPGGLHPIRVRYFNASGGGSIKLWWTLVGRPREIVPNEVFYPHLRRPAGGR